MKKFLLMLTILCVCGFVSADLCVATIQDKDIFLSQEQFIAYAYNETRFKDVFWSVLYERGKLLIGIILLMFTPLREKLSVILVSIFSFLFGFFCMSCILSLGMVGVVVAIFTVIPHGILYFIVILLLLQRRQTKRYIERNRRGKSLLTFVILIFIFVAGCVLETVVGTQFVPWIIRLSLI